MNMLFLQILVLMVTGFLSFFLVKHAILRFVKKREYAISGSHKISLRHVMPSIPILLFLFCIEWIYLFVAHTGRKEFIVATAMLLPINIALGWVVETGYDALNK